MAYLLASWLETIFPNFYLFWVYVEQTFFAAQLSTGGMLYIVHVILFFSVLKNLILFHFTGKIDILYYRDKRF